jgi:hypothetical protein
MVFIYYFLIISSKAKNSIFFLNEKHEITYSFCNEKQGELTLTDIRSINFEDCLPLIYI